MPTRLCEVAVHADDAPRAKRFHTPVLGLDFTPWGLPDFYQSNTPATAVLGSRF